MVILWEFFLITIIIGDYIPAKLVINFLFLGAVLYIDVHVYHDWFNANR